MVEGASGTDQCGRAFRSRRACASSCGVRLGLGRGLFCWFCQHQVLYVLVLSTSPFHVFHFTPPFSYQDEQKLFYVLYLYGQNVMSTQMLELSLFGVRTVPRLETEAWSMVKHLRLTTNEHVPLPPLPPRPANAFGNPGSAVVGRRTRRRTEARGHHSEPVRDRAAVPRHRVQPWRPPARNAPAQVEQPPREVVGR